VFVYVQHAWPDAHVVVPHRDPVPPPSARVATSTSEVQPASVTSAAAVARKKTFMCSSY